MKRVLILVCLSALVLALGVSPALAAERSYGGAHAPSHARPLQAPPVSAAPGMGALVAPNLGVRPLVAGGGANITTAISLPQYINESDAPSGTVDSVSHPHDVYRIFLEQGASIGATLTLGTPGSQVAYRIFSPYATDVSQEPLFSDTTYGENPRFRVFTAPIGGYYYIDIEAVTGSSTYTLDYWWWHDNDDIPGVAVSASPIFSALQYDWNWDDVTRYPLAKGDKIALSVSPVATWLTTSDFDADLFLHGPSSEGVAPHNPSNPGIVALSWNYASDNPVDSLTYTAPVAGYYFSDVYDAVGNGTAFLTWRVTPARPVIKLSPSATKLTYKRKKGKVVFTLNARFSNAYSLPYNAATTYLQGSKNGKTKWANKIKLTTNADGRVGAKITAKKKSVGYYRWATKVGSVWTYGKVQKVTIK